MSGNFDQWDHNQWLDTRDIQWRIVSDVGYIATWRHSRTIRKAFTIGHTVACRHAPDGYC